MSRPTDPNDIPYMQSIDKINVIYYDWLPDRHWDDCVLCGEYRLINHAVAFYEEPVHEEIGTKLWHGGVVGGMSCCKECHDNHYAAIRALPIDKGVEG